MGLIRKTMSVTTLGFIDFQSDKERVARSARLTKQATRRGNRLIGKQTRAQRRQHREMMAVQSMQVPMMPTQPAPGWYADAQPGYMRWWDGMRWTAHVQPAPW